MILDGKVNGVKYLKNFYELPSYILLKECTVQSKHNNSEMVVLFDDSITHDKILSTSSLYEVKKLGSHVKNCDAVVWNNEAKRLILKGGCAKFTQNGFLENLAPVDC